MLRATALLPVSLVLALLTPAAGASARPAAIATRAAVTSPAVTDLQRRLSAALSTGTGKVVGGAVDIDGVGGAFRTSSGSMIPPASTQKLFTTLAALSIISPDARFTTEVRSTGRLAGGTLVGDLYLVGGGDPFFSMALLDHLAQLVRRAGITRVTGRLYVDDFRYDHVHSAVGWKAEWVPEESGPLDALAVDGNTWRKDAAFLKDPGAGNVVRFQQLLAGQGVTVSRQIGRAHLPAGATQVTRLPSATLAAIVTRIDKESDNFAAELLVKELGHLTRNKGTTADGVAAVRAEMTRLGATMGTTGDGSGLSSQDRESALSELSVLTAAASTSSYKAFVTALPIACKDGTLEKRMCGTAAAGRTHAKTGTLDTAHTLAGWTTTADGHLARFAFLVGGFSSSTKATAALDRATAVLAAAHV